MIRKAILTLGMLAVASIGYAQSKQSCATDEFYRAQKAIHPGIVIEEARLNAEIQQYLKGRISNPRAKTTGANDNWPSDTNQMHIPVVVHIIQDFAGQQATPITDDGIYEMIARLNAVYNGTDPSITAGIINPFKPYIGTAHISFHLATKDPNGKPTRGIDRINSYHSSGGDELAKINGWAPDQYLNIWFENIVGRAGAALYATFPTSYTDNPYSQGIIGLADYANNRPTPGVGGVAVAHEVGHFLFLYHVWNSNSRAAEDRVNPVCGDDEVDDTPPTIGHQSCGNVNLYDTMCAKGYFKNYDSATYSVMTGIDLPNVVTANESSNTFAAYNDSTRNFLGQTFTTGSTSAFLQSISVMVDTGANNNAMTQMSLYNAAGTTRLAKSDSIPAVPGGSLLTYTFAGYNMAPNTMYKFVIEPFGGHAKFPLRAANNDPYNGGSMYKDSAAKTAVPGSDLYFTVKRYYRMDYPDTTNTQNIMDYSYCNSQMFTKAQVARMRAALRSDVGYRSTLSSNKNLAQTGVWDSVANVAIAAPDIAPTADFSVNRPFVCADGNVGVTFTDRSYNDTTSVAWTFDKGASNPTSSAKTVNNTFSQAGWVTVSLTATGNNTGSNTLTRSDKVYAADPTAKDPNGYFQEFNPGGDLDKYPIFNFFGTNHRWELVNNAGYYDQTSIRYKNFDTRVGSANNISNASESPRGDYADFYTPAFDLSGFGSACNLTFYSAGAFRTNKSGEMNDKLEIYTTNDCGLTWRLVDSLKGGRIGNNGYRNDDFTPSWMGEWKQQSIPVSSRGPQTYFRFRYKAGVADPVLAPLGFYPYHNFGTGNNFYLDRINITNAPLFVKNGVIVNLGMSVAPNPTSGAATVTLNGGDNTVADLSVTDVTGKLVYSSSVVRAAAATKVEIPASALAVKGMYLVKVVTNGATETQKLVVY